MTFGVSIVQYKLREDPKLLMSGDIPYQGGHVCMSLSPDARIVAVAINSSIFMSSTATGSLLETLDNIHRGEMLAIQVV